jgi:hypothetical protein
MDKSSINRLQEHKAELLWRHIGTLPVVEIVLQVSIADAAPVSRTLKCVRSVPKLEVLKELSVVHDIKAVEHIEAGLQSLVSEQIMLNMMSEMRYTPPWPESERHPRSA